MGNEKSPYSPIYFPEIWNNSKYIKYTHNCYEYALDDLSLKEASVCKKNYNKWDNFDSIKKTCKRTNTFSQPGYYGKLGKNKKVTCENLKTRILADNSNNANNMECSKNNNKSSICLSNKNEKCAKNYYKIASVADEKNNYFHFYRQNIDGTWSHKPGSTPATNLDESNKLITNLENADMMVNDKMNYKICNYFCVASNKYMNTNSSSKVL